MILRCWLLVWHTYRDLWLEMESFGSYVTSAGSRMNGHGICRVNRQTGVRPTSPVFGSMLSPQRIANLPHVTFVIRKSKTITWLYSNLLCLY